MHRFAILTALLVSFLISMTMMSSPCLAQGDEPRSIIGPRLSALLESEEMQPNDEDSHLKKLMKARYNAVLLELNERHDGMLKGLQTLDQMIDAGRRLLDAELALASTDEDKAAVLERAIGVVEEFERKLELRLKNNFGSTANLYRMRYGRLNLAVELEKLRGE